MSGVYTKESHRRMSEDVCRILNERFGYQRALLSCLVAIGIDPGYARSMLVHARTRNLDQFDVMLQEELQRLKEKE